MPERAIPILFMKVPGMLNKVERARIIVRTLLELAETHGYDAPSRMREVDSKVRYVDYDKRWSLRISPGCRRTIARTSETIVRDVVVAAPGCVLFELDVAGASRMIVNVVNGDVRLFKYVPGAWERIFGAEPEADTVTLLPDLFVDPNEACWRDFLASPDGQWPASEAVAEHAAS